MIVQFKYDVNDVVWFGPSKHEVKRGIITEVEFTKDKDGSKLFYSAKANGISYVFKEEHLFSSIPDFVKHCDAQSV